MNEYKRKEKRKEHETNLKYVNRVFLGANLHQILIQKIWYNLHKGFFMGKNGIDSLNLEKKFKSPNLYDKFK